MAKKLPDDVIKRWPEVFGDIDVNVIPLEYLASIRVTFEDQTQWDIDLAEKAKHTPEDLETMLADLFEEYDDSIAGIDFRLDTDKVKRDITSRTHRFMKKRK